MIERSLLMNGPMVRSTLADLKTQTRRTRGMAVVNENPDAWELVESFPGCVAFLCGQEIITVKSPYGVPGDRLWVREAWRTIAENDHVRPRDLEHEHSPIWYEATEISGIHADCGFGKLRPSMFMPRWASRLTLEVVSVRPERLQYITEEDAIAEGIRRMKDGSGVFVGGEGPGRLVTPWATAREAFFDLWESINGPGSWATDPWVWRVEFKVLAKESA